MQDEKVHQKLNCCLREQTIFNLRQVQEELKWSLRRMRLEGRGDMTKQEDPSWMKDNHVTAKMIKLSCGIEYTCTGMSRC